MLESGPYRRRIENRIRAGNAALPLLEGMSYHQPARSARRRTRSAILAALFVVGATLVGGLGHKSLTGSPSAASLVVPELWADRAYDPAHGDPAHGDPSGRGRGDRHAALGVADGEVPDGVTVFDEEYAAVANLDPALLAALRRAATDARGDAVELHVSSGWRSAAYQERLLDEAVSTYGSRAEAARWVAGPATSPHVSGDAVDIGPSDAAAWLSDHGAEHGLCQIYRNEPWHYELRPESVDHGCPPAYADPTHDPRMQH